MRGGAAWNGRGRGGVGFIGLATAATYCIGHKSSFPPNLSFKQIIQGVVMHQRYCGSPGGWRRRRAGGGGARPGERDRAKTDILSGQPRMEGEVTEGETVAFRTKTSARFKGIVHANPTQRWRHSTDGSDSIVFYLNK